MSQINKTEKNLGSDSLQNSSNFNVDATTLRIVIAESNPAILERLLQTMQEIGKWTIYICGEYTELIQTMSLGTTDLLLLGNIDQSSCFEICRICQQEWEESAGDYGIS